jgi:hypothetical protein
VYRLISLWLVSGVLAVPRSLYGQTDTIAHRIVLIGDAGQLTEGKHPVVDAVRNLIPLDEKTTILFLGDNLYKNGLPDNTSPTYNKDRAVLDSQLSVADHTPVKVYMIPGNHDWKNGSRDGYEAILRQQLYVDQLGKPNVEYFPKGGCPGPVEIDIDSTITLILFDSQWWLHPYDKPGIESDCDSKTKEEVVTQIKDIAQHNANKLILLACHHPFKSYGPHGGYFTLKQHIFPFTDISPNAYIPLPVIGSIYPIARSVYGTPQDLRHPTYSDMVTKISEAIKPVSQNVVFVSGHEHNLEFIKQGGYNYIICGGGCKTNRVSRNKKSEFSNQSVGFSVLEISTHNNVTITFYTVTDSVKKIYTGFVLNFSPPTKPVEVSHTTEVRQGLFKDTTVAANADFKPVAGLKKIFAGQNYRPEWSTPVKMKALDIKSSGLKITSIGGGQQTKTLHLKDKAGTEWVLRSINKKNNAFIPGPMQKTAFIDLSKELNNAAHPYGALIIPGFTRALNIIAPTPQLVFLPDDARLGEYKNDFRNKPYMLEERLTTYMGKKTLSSSEVLNNQLKEHDYRVDEASVLKARLLDMLVGDYDRHFDQWRWYNNGDKMFKPIPRDRDEAFFSSDGQLLKEMSGRIMPYLKGFSHKMHDVDWLSYSAKDFDRIFLTQLDKKDWQSVIHDFNSAVTDSVIGSSVKNLPPEIYKIDGDRIAAKLKERLSILPEKAIRYYNFLSRKVNIIGSNQKEYFHLSHAADGLQVKVYSRNEAGDTSRLIYSRVFDAAITKEIRLFGLNGDDYFYVDPSVSSSIKLRIIGGKGVDTFDIHGNIENLLYDRKADSNYIRHYSRTKNRFSVDPIDETRNILNYEYNISRIPLLHGGYNSDDGLLFGIAAAKTTFAFDNFPFATSQRLSVLCSFKNAVRFDYNGEFNHVTRKADVVVTAKYLLPALKNFYGIGNITGADRIKSFYRIQYREAEASVLLRHRYFERMSISIGPYLYYYQGDVSKNRYDILGIPGAAGLDSASVFGKKTYAGGRFNFRFSNSNDELFPTRGVVLFSDLLYAAGLGDQVHNFSRFSSGLQVFMSQNDPTKSIVVINIGGEKIFSDRYPYSQAPELGADNYLRGFARERFTGKSSIHASVELRKKIADLNTYILPGPLWIFGFYDGGKVWPNLTGGNTWHNSYGAGLYFIPFHLFIASATFGFSPETNRLNVSIGSRINLTY